MPDTNDVSFSRILGRLEADSSAAKNQRAEIFTQLKDVKAKVSCLPQLAKTVESHSMVIDDYKRLKQRAIGIVIAVTGLASALASGLSYLANKFMLK